MRTITAGHKYELSNFDVVERPGQTLQFIEKEPDPHGGDKLITINDGTTTEEVVEMLIDRMQHLQAKFPCRENAIVITKLDEALLWLNKRTSDRNKRGVEGKALK